MTISKVCTRIIRDSIGYSFRFLINPLANSYCFMGGIPRSWVRQDCPFIHPLSFVWRGIYRILYNVKAYIRYTGATIYRTVAGFSNVFYRVFQMVFNKAYDEYRGDYAFLWVFRTVFYVVFYRVFHKLLYKVFYRAYIRGILESILWDILEAIGYSIRHQGILY